MRLRLLLALAMATTACEHGVTDAGCPAPNKCEVSGIDLVPVSAVVDSASIVERHGCCVGDIVNASSIDVRVVIVNRGSVASLTADAEVSAFASTTRFSVPSIPPGGSVVKQVALDFERQFLMAGTDPGVENVKVRLLKEDAHPENNVFAGHRIMIDIPFLTLHPELRAPQTVRVGENITFSFSYEFDSWTFSRPTSTNVVSVLFCLESGTRTCTRDNWQAVAKRNLSDFYRQQTTVIVPLTPQALPVPAPGQYRILICAIPRNRADLHVQPNNPDDHCRGAGMVTVTS